VIFAMDEWCSGMVQGYIETYDTRSDRWNRVLEEDPAGRHVYHGTAVIRGCIHSIGGYDGIVYFNTCRMFNAVTKKWTEVYFLNYCFFFVPLSCFYF
jgi:kelch-like protein 10